MVEGEIVAVDYIEYDYDPMNLPQDVLQAIGLVIACAADAESGLDEAIAGLIGTDYERGKAISSHMNMPVKFGAVRSLAQTRFSGVLELDAINGILGELERSLAARNRYAHGVWATQKHDKTPVLIESKARNGVEVNVRIVDVAEVIEIAKGIKAASLSLVSFLNGANFVPDFPPIDRPRGHYGKKARTAHRNQSLNTG